MTAKEHSFGKEERLKSNSAIQQLLEHGRTLTVFPFKAYWIVPGGPEQKFPVRISISIPRKKFPRAVDRNLMKRRIRETYRRNKGILYEPLRGKNTNMVMLILFISDELLPFKNLDAALQKLLRKLADSLP